MNRDTPDNEWELSKENVQPIRQGRKLSSLNAGLKQYGGVEDQQIKEEKHFFETELRTYCGADPIEVWYRYILWAEQTFPRGGPESVLTKLLERCARQFKDTESYRNDERYIYVWMKMADMCNEPLEMYNFMYVQNIGCELACFYEGWSSMLEQVGNFKKADAVFQMGLTKGAQPLDTLKHKHEQFLQRVARRVATNMDSGQDSASPPPEAEGQHRQVLSQLRTLGKHKQAPVNRAGSAIRGSAGVLAGGSVARASFNVSGCSIKVYTDENQPASVLPPQTGQYSTGPHEKAVNKENEKKAGQWHKHKLKSTSIVPVSEVLPFTVHVDDEDKNLRTPAKVPDIGKQVLSSRKEEKSSTSDYLQTMSGATSVEERHERPMYCKSKVYCGLEEFSFEELRAMMWTRKQHQAQERALTEMRERLERERLQLLEEAERIRAQRLTLQQEEQAMFDEAKRKRAEIKQQLLREREQEEKRHHQAVSDTIQSRVQEQQAVSDTIRSRVQEQQARTQSFSSAAKSSSRQQLVFCDITTKGNTENIQPAKSKYLPSNGWTSTQQAGNRDSSCSGSQYPQSAQAGNQYLHSAQAGNQYPQSAQEANQCQQTGSNKFSLTGSGVSSQITDGRRNHSLNSSNPTPNSVHNANSFERTMHGGASPTVNTKEALQLVMGMFNGSLDLEHCKEPDTSQIDTQDIPSHGAGKGSLPFQIYDESEVKSVQPSVSIGQTCAPVPFQIYDESEGRPTPKQQSDSMGKPIKSVPFLIFMEENTASSCSSMNQSQNVSVRRQRVKTASGTDQDSSQRLQDRALSMTRPFFDDDGIESQPRDDVTLAPLGSHLSFAEAARFASTPFNPNSSGSRARKIPDLDESAMEVNDGDDRADMSGVEFQGLAINPPVPSTHPALVSSTDPVMVPGTDPTLMPDTHPALIPSTPPTDTREHSLNLSSNAFMKDLSPIMEGSSEDSSASSKQATLHHTTMEACSRLHLTPVADQTENTSVLLAAAADAVNETAHEIDVTTYIPPVIDEKTEQLVPMSICIADSKDPFDRAEKDKILAALKPPLHHYDNYNALDEVIPNIRKNGYVSLGLRVFEIEDKVGEGGFAKIFRAVDTNDCFDTVSIISNYVTKKLAIKVEEPAQHWEFYICTELHRRLAKLNDPVDVRPAVMNIEDGYFFKNGSILTSEYQPYGTILDMVNKSKKNFEHMVGQLEPVMVYMTVELLHLVENLHRCHIIHGDIKPDNFLILPFPRVPESDDPQVVFGGCSRFVQLIDFGRSIDMSRYPHGTTFHTKVNTDCFQCIEMKTNRPWTYQTDLFGLAGTIHVLLHSQYMKVYQEAGVWKVTSSYNRGWHSDLWKKLFTELLNVPSCSELPDLAELRQEFEQFFVTDLLHKYNRLCPMYNKIVKGS